MKNLIITLFFALSFVTVFAQSTRNETEPTTVETFYKVNDVSEITTDDVVIIVNEEYGKAMGTQKTNNRDGAAITINEEDGSITPNDSVYRFELTRKGDYFLLRDLRWNKYLYLGTRTGHRLYVHKISNETDYIKISFTDGNADMFFEKATNYSYPYIRYQTEDNFFDARSKTENKPVQIYKKKREFTAQPINVGNTGYASLYYGTENLKVPHGVTASTYKIEGNKIIVSKDYLAGETIPKGTAVILRGEPGEFNFEITTHNGDADTNNMLKGTDEDAMTEGEGYFYKLTTKNGKNPGFYWAEENGEPFMNKAHKAYLVVPKTTEAMQGYDFDNTQAGIENIETSLKLNDIYNLQGVKVDNKNLPKGVYIQNNKKIIVK